MTVRMVIAFVVLMVFLAIFNS
ncbi:MAG: hypothetical protein GY945_15710 [Rhodobacteraceae bacterium]|nr:hypothetical protein [Paracoccaceae bacterium]